jgi:hypothetical protein
MNPYKNIYFKRMTKELALFIKETRKTSTWRYLASVVAEKYPYLKISPGNQMEGQELCTAAWLFLKDKEDWR